MSEMEKRPPKPRKVKIMPKKDPEVPEMEPVRENILQMNEMVALTDIGNRGQFMDDILWQVRHSFAAEDEGKLYPEFITSKRIIEEMRSKALNMIGQDVGDGISVDEMLLCVFNTLLAQAVKERGKGREAFSDVRDASWFLVNYKLCNFLAKAAEKPMEKSLYDLSDIAFFLANELDLEN